MEERTKKVMLTRAAGVGAVLSGAGPLSPIVALQVEQAHDAFSRSQKKRVHALLTYALHGVDDVELADRLNRAFVVDDPAIVAAFVQSARL